MGGCGGGDGGCGADMLAAPVAASTCVVAAQSVEMLRLLQVRLTPLMPGSPRAGAASSEPRSCVGSGHSDIAAAMASNIPTTAWRGKDSEEAAADDVA